MAATKNIMVLGGGYAGVLTAKNLAKRVKKDRLQNEVSVTLIDKNPFHTMLTELHEVAADRVDEASIKMDLNDIFAGRGVNVVLDHITGIDFENKTLTGRDDKRYMYDYLVIGSGSKSAYWDVAGAREHSFPLCAFEDAVRLKTHLLAVFRQAAATADVEKRRALLTFFVVGGGFTGVEMIGELAEWIPVACEQFHIAREDVRLCLVDALGRIIPSLPERLSEKAAKRLRKTGVAVRTGTKVVRVGEESITLENAGKTETVPTATVIWTAGIEGSEIVCAADIEKTKGQRIETNPYLQSKQYAEVYIVGDNLYYIPEGDKELVPQMVENCEASAHTAAYNIIADITEKTEKQPYRPKFHGMMVSIGGRYGTAYVGTHRTKFALPSFFSMLAKHMINILYFIQVLGWHKVYSYLLHEIFRVRNNRSFVGGHFANYAPNFWSVPLRLFLGGSWLLEGWDKLLKVLADPTHIFLFSIPGADGVASATQAVTDAATSATQAVSEYGEALPVPGFIQDIVDWSMRVFIAPVAPYFQAFMVIAEIVIGVCLILGLFTALISAFSCLLCLMIYVSGMAAASVLWYFVAAVALIGVGGTGQVFSIDYYLLPWLKKRWRRLGLVRKWYIYND